MTNINVVILLACVAFSSVQAKRKTVSLRQTDKVECNSTILANIDRCCDMPKLLAMEHVTKCFSVIKNITILETETTNCLVECVLKAQNVLTSTGAIDVTKCSNEFVNPAMNIWQPVITKAINTCASQLAAKMPRWTTVPKSCNPRPALFMSCMGHYLALECPSASTISTTAINCQEKKDHLAVCDPYKGI